MGGEDYNKDGLAQSINFLSLLVSNLLRLDLDVSNN